MPGAPGANSRGRGGKFKKYTRGGGKHYSRNLRPLDENGNEISMWSEDAQKQFKDGSGEEDEDESGGSSDDAGASSSQAKSREDRKAEKKKRKEAAIARKLGQGIEVGDMPSSDEDSSEEDSDDDMPVNPNHTKAARNQARVAREPPAEVDKDEDVDEAADGVKKMSVAGMNRKERESSEAAAAKERYRKLHEQGKTDEAKADLARLKVIREQRATEAARRQAEKEEKEAQEAARKAEIDAKEAKKRAAAIGPTAKKVAKKSVK